MTLYMPHEWTQAKEPSARKCYKPVWNINAVSITDNQAYVDRAKLRCETYTAPLFSCDMIDESDRPLLIYLSFCTSKGCERSYQRQLRTRLGAFEQVVGYQGSDTIPHGTEFRMPWLIDIQDCGSPLIIIQSFRNR
jgi:hypothetical protein